MHDLRYHIFYLIAIFLMLGVGILFGASVTGPEQVRRQSQAIRSLQAATTKVVQDRDQSRDRLAKDETVLSALRPKLVRGKLAGQRVVLIQTGDYLDAAEASNTALTDAGATVVATVALTSKWGTLTAKRRDALASVAPSSDPVAQDAALLAALASVMTSGIDAGGPPAAALTALQGQELVTVTGDLSLPCHLFVLVGGSRDDGTPDAVTAPLLEGFRTVPGPVTLVGCEPLAAEVSSIPAYQAAGISTVDCVDQPLGQLALPFALRGDLGDYGLKPTARQVLPSALGGEPI